MKALLVFSTALVFSFASCGADDHPGGAKTSTPATETTAASTGKIHKLVSVAKSPGSGLATDFTWESNGKKMSLSEVGKDKVVFLNFWGTWCPPCRREIPDIVEISNEMKNVVVIGIALERSGTDKLADFISQNKIPYDNIVGENSDLGKLTQAYGGISAVPTTFIIKDGKIISTIVGGRNKDFFQQEIKKAI